MPLFQQVDLFRFPGNLPNYVTAYHIPSFIRNPPFPSHALLITFFRAAFGLTSCNRIGFRRSSHDKVAVCEEGPPALWERPFGVWSSGPRTFHTNPITGPLEIWMWHSHLYQCSRPVPLWMRYEPFMSPRYKTKSYENRFLINVLARVRSVVLYENLVLNRMERIKLYWSPLTESHRW
jgi:hypothetical protein